MLAAQMFDGASLRDIGVAPGGLENATRQGRRLRLIAPIVAPLRRR